MNSQRAALRYSFGIQLTSYDLSMQNEIYESNSVINEEVDGIDFDRYKYIERDSTVHVLRPVCFKIRFI